MKGNLMGYYGGCLCGVSGCNGRHSIDSVTGRPIYIEDYVIPVFKGSTLEFLPALFTF